MEIRRAILLFAVVLGLAAVVTALEGGSRNDRDTGDAAPAPPPSSPTSAAGDGPPARDAQAVRFDAARAPARRSATVGQPATVRVSADEPGDVELRGLGLLVPVEPSAPAQFDILPDSPGTYRVTFAPAGGTDARTVGTLAVEPAAK